LRNRNPWGQWVELNDKRGQGIFYYNTVDQIFCNYIPKNCSLSFCVKFEVSRLSQWEKPKDFKKDKKRVVKDVNYGLNFYH
jgi:hypothetical protein